MQIVVGWQFPTEHSCGPDPNAVAEAIRRTLPESRWDVRRRAFELARELKALPHLAEAEAADLRPVLQQWHWAALPKLDGLGFEDAFSEFLAAWPRVKLPAGKGPLYQVLDIARRSGPPAETLKYGDKFRLLASLCRELQRHAGEEPFFLGCRTAGKLLDTTHVTAWKYFLVLQAIRVLKMIEQGSRVGRKATRWHYTGSDLNGRAA